MLRKNRKAILWFLISTFCLAVSNQTLKGRGLDELFFMIPGINEYLHERFMNLLSQNAKERFQVRNLTMISLASLFDLAMRVGDFGDLQKLIDRYWRMIAGRKTDSKKMGAIVISCEARQVLMKFMNQN